MKIPRDLYYILNRPAFSSAPWRRERSVKESLKRFVKEDLHFDLIWKDPFYDPRHEEDLYPLPKTSSVRFVTPICSVHDLEFSEDIKFQPFAYHAGDEQPLLTEEALKRKKQGEDLELMHMPVGSLTIPFGENFHTVTDREFKSMVGKARKPFGLTWQKWDRHLLTSPGYMRPPAEREVSSTTARKVEFLQRCMSGFRIVDPGSRGKQEAVQVLTRFLHLRRFYACDTHEDVYWLNWRPEAYMYDTPGPNKEITRTFVQIPEDRSDTEVDYQTVQVRLVAAHEGDREPISVAKDKALDNGETELMQVPLGFIPWIKEERLIGRFEQPIDWTWTEDWEEPSEWAWADGWEKPIELTWQKLDGFEDGVSRSTIQKIIFLRHYVKMIYIVDTGKGIGDDQVVSAIEELAGIEFRVDFNSIGQGYWWKVQHDAPSTKSNPQPSGFCNPPSRPGKDRSDPRVPSQTVVDLYGGDEEQAHTHWCNTH